MKGKYSFQTEERVGENLEPLLSFVRAAKGSWFRDEDGG